MNIVSKLRIICIIMRSLFTMFISAGRVCFISTEVEMAEKQK